MKKCKVKISYNLLKEWLLLPHYGHIEYVTAPIPPDPFHTDEFEVYIEGVGPDLPPEADVPLVTPVFTTHIPTTANWDEL